MFSNSVINFLGKALDSFNSVGESIVFFNLLSIFGINDIKLPLVIGILLFGCVFYTIKLRFINIFKLKYATKILLNSESDHKNNKSTGKQESISSLKALSVSIAGAAGLGNIAGVAAAITVGGIGSIFWMLIAALMCMPLRFAEVFLGHYYRIKNGNEFLGGPAYYITSGLKEIGWAKIGKVVAVIYAVMFCFSTIGGPSSFQINQVSQSLATNFGFGLIGRAWSSLVIVVLVGIVITGGVKRIGSVISKILPVMICVYFISCLYIIFINYQALPKTICSILSAAFSSPSSLYGGFIGAAVIAFQRIIVANETGFGTAATIHSNSSNNDSIKEGFVSMASPIIDTIFVCFITGIVIVITDSYNPNLQGIDMLITAFRQENEWMKYIISAMTPIMAMNLMIAWSYYGIKNIKFLFGDSKLAKYSFIAIFLLAGLSGGLITNFMAVIKLTDILVLSLVIPNVTAVVLLNKKVLEKYKKYNNK